MQVHRKVLGVFRLLTEPAASVTNEDHRRNARWLMQLMVLLLPAGIFVTLLDALITPPPDAPVYGILPFLASSLFWLIPYLLSRRGRYQAAAVFLVLIALIPIFASQTTGVENFDNLHYLLMPMLMASVVIEGRAFWMLSAMQVVLLMLLPLIVKEITWQIVGIDGVAFFAIGVALIWRVTAHRNDLEYARTSQLHATNWALKHQIAARRQAEERALQLAVEQERMRVFTEFIGAAAHDFMTPISGIMTSQYLARRVDDADKQAQYLDQIEQHAGRINTLVDALLDMSRLESGTEIDFRPTSIQSLLRNACEQVRASIEDKQLQLTIDLDSLHTDIKASQQQLNCAFTKLLDNAIQFTPTGGQISIVGAEDEQDLIIEIRDTGEGIPGEAIPHIFDQFYRGDTARSSQTGGLGLGLSYVKRVIMLHDGKIDVESTPGSGTTVRIHLPKVSTKPVAPVGAHTP